nr:MAG TPA: Peroxidase, family 2 [Bacteriophage sp.]
MPDFLLTTSAPPETPHIFYISAPCPALNTNLVLNFQKNAMLT